MKTVLMALIITSSICSANQKNHKSIHNDLWECVHLFIDGTIEEDVYAWVHKYSACPPYPMHGAQPWKSEPSNNKENNTIKEAPTEPECIIYKRKP